MRYEALAPIYDRMMSHVEYNEWVSLIDRIVSKYSSVKSPKIFEIGGGTGILGERLINKGYDYQGSDYSFSMCREAVRKEVKFFCADGRSLPLKKRFDLVLFLYDGINYIQSIEQYSTLFHQISSCLEKNGLFLFDITTETNSLAHFIDYLDFEDFGDCSYVRHSYYDETSMMQYNDFTIYCIDNNKSTLFRKFKEHHEQKVFPAKLIEDIVPRSLFKVLGVFHEYSFKKYSPDSERIHFLLKKTGS